jgi:hypothetical protein
MVFTTGTAFFSGVADVDAFSFSEVPDDDGALDEAEAVSGLRGGTFSADSAVSSDEEVLPPPKNPLSLPTK